MTIEPELRDKLKKSILDLVDEIECKPIFDRDEHGNIIIYDFDEDEDGA